MSQTPNTAIAVIGIDIGKNSFHVVGHDARGAIVLRQKWSRGQVEARLANIPPCLIGMEACVGAHHLSRKLASLGHDARLMPANMSAPIARDREAQVQQRIGIIFWWPYSKPDIFKLTASLDTKVAHIAPKIALTTVTGELKPVSSSRSEPYLS